MKAYLYKIKNKINDKAYIGQTIQTLRERWSQHCNTRSSCKILRAAIQKYGKENFDIIVIEEIEYEDKTNIVIELNDKEMKLIKDHNTLVPNGYNVNKGGNNAPGRRWKTPPFLGKKWSIEQREKFIKSRTGVKVGPKTPEQIAKTAEKNKKQVICIETGQIWNSVQECADFFNVKSKQVSRVLKKQRKRLKWRYTLSYFKQSLR